MTFDNRQPTVWDGLSLMELDLYHLIMDYRAAQGLAPIPLSLGLTATAGRHAADTLYNIWEPGLVLPAGANLHSWSDAPYYSDHSQASVMWDAPERIGTSYTDTGFEISAAGYGSIAAALAGWQGSSGHNTVIVNQGIWANYTWNAIGIGVEIDPSVGTYGGRIYHVWFGRAADPGGAPVIAGTAGADEVGGTAFADVIGGKAGNDRLRGLGGDDDLNGGRGRDKLFGGSGEDDLAGHGGRDRLNGGAGDDVLAGGARPDAFVFTGRDWGTDRITDFDGDRVVIRAAGEAATAGELAAALTDVGGSAVYDHLGDGKNVIVFEGVSAAALTADLFGLA